MLLLSLLLSLWSFVLFPVWQSQAHLTGPRPLTLCIQVDPFCVYWWTPFLPLFVYRWTPSVSTGGLRSPTLCLQVDPFCVHWWTPILLLFVYRWTPSVSTGGLRSPTLCIQVDPFCVHWWTPILLLFVYRWTPSVSTGGPPSSSLYTGGPLLCLLVDPLPLCIQVDPFCVYWRTPFLLFVFRWTPSVSTGGPPSSYSLFTGALPPSLLTTLCLLVTPSTFSFFTGESPLFTGKPSLCLMAEFHSLYWWTLTLCTNESLLFVCG